MKTLHAILPMILLLAGLATAQTAVQNATPFEAPDDAPPEASVAPDAQPRVATQDLLALFSDDPDRFTQTDGADLYATSCRACHMQDGTGAKGAGNYPPLAGNAKLQSKYYIVTVLLTGYHGMPRFGDQMDDAQIAEVSNYVRSSWGNDFPGIVSPQDVASLRRAGE